MLTMKQVSQLLKVPESCIKVERSLRTVDYAPHWGLKELLRELNQNSLDISNKTTEVSFTNISAVFKDSSEHGMSLKAFLLMGYTTKDGIESRGRWGEGLKVSLAKEIKEGFKVVARSQDWVCCLDVDDFKGEQRVVYYYVENLTPFYKGVRYEIFGREKYADEIMMIMRDYFYDYNDPRILMKERTANDKFYSTILGSNFKGKLYNKNIYVKDINSFYGWDLAEINDLGRDRNKVDANKMRQKMGMIISKITDSDLARQMCRLFVKGGKEEAEITVFYPHHYNYQHMWTIVFKELFGDNAVIGDDAMLSQRIAYRGARLIVIQNVNILYGLKQCGIQSAEIFLKEYDARLREQKKKPFNELTKTKQNKLIRGFRLIKKTKMFYTIEAEFKNMVQEYPKTNNEIAHYDPANDKVNVAKELFASPLYEIAQTIGHELLHKETGHHDITRGFQQALDKFSAKLLMVIIDKEKEEIKFECKVEHGNYNKIIKIPTRAGKKVVAPKYYEVILREIGVE